jgi:RNA polymerase sigma-70 factor, ECF subfamily
MQASALSVELLDTSPSDATLLARVGRGDTAAFEGLYDRHRAIAHSRAMRFCRNAPDAEEIVQDAFVKVWRSAASYDPSRGSARNWILTMVTRRAIGGYRQSRHRLSEHSVDGLEGKLTADGDTHLQIEANERKQAVRSALCGLPADQRQALGLTYYVGLSHAEVAATTRAALGTVKGRIRLGHARMRNSLGEALAISADVGRRMPPPRIDCATAASPGCGGHAS